MVISNIWSCPLISAMLLPHSKHTSTIVFENPWTNLPSFIWTIFSYTFTSSKSTFSIYAQSYKNSFLAVSSSSSRNVNSMYRRSTFSASSSPLRTSLWTPIVLIQSLNGLSPLPFLISKYSLDLPISVAALMMDILVSCSSSLASYAKIRNSSGLPIVKFDFDKLKPLFTSASIIHHFNSNPPLFDDNSGFALSGILCQPDPDTGLLHPIAFWSRKWISAECNYDIHDCEMLAIVECFKHWRHYLEESKHLVRVHSDHKNLESFMTTKILKRRQARWAEILSGYDFVLNHVRGSKNPADDPSRRPDYAKDVDRPSGALIPPSASRLLPLESLPSDIPPASSASSTSINLLRCFLNASVKIPVGFIAPQNHIYPQFRSRCQYASKGSLASMVLE
jgi:hypothetical protein